MVSEVTMPINELILSYVFKDVTAYFQERDGGPKVKLKYYSLT